MYCVDHWQRLIRAEEDMLHPVVISLRAVEAGKDNTAFELLPPLLQMAPAHDPVQREVSESGKSSHDTLRHKALTISVRHTCRVQPFLLPTAAVAH